MKNNLTSKELDYLIKLIDIKCNETEEEYPDDYLELKELLTKLKALKNINQFDF